MNPTTQELLERSDLDIMMRTIPTLLKRFTYSVAAQVIPKAREVFGNASFSLNMKSQKFPILLVSMIQGGHKTWTVEIDIPGNERLSFMNSEERKAVIDKKVGIALEKIEEVKRASRDRASSEAF